MVWKWNLTANRVITPVFTIVFRTSVGILTVWGQTLIIIIKLDNSMNETIKV